mmetsp:Transcript_2948/g.4278  ORF Transcript_2948/g.4278 Transcript_2948/m.4278 type:complete len:273 (+) Transcript_2948:115-933(+)
MRMMRYIRHPCTTHIDTGIHIHTHIKWRMEPSRRRSTEWRSIRTQRTKGWMGVVWVERSWVHPSSYCSAHHFAVHLGLFAGAHGVWFAGAVGCTAPRTDNVVTAAAAVVIDVIIVVASGSSSDTTDIGRMGWSVDAATATTTAAVSSTFVRAGSTSCSIFAELNPFGITIGIDQHMLSSSFVVFLDCTSVPLFIHRPKYFHLLANHAIYTGSCFWCSWCYFIRSRPRSISRPRSRFGRRSTLCIISYNWFLFLVVLRLNILLLLSVVIVIDT